MAYEPSQIPNRVRATAQELPDPSSPSFGDAFDPLFARARIVLLGEASHGTSEFYRARAALTQRLIERHGFSIVAVEADWPDAATIDRFVRQRQSRHAPPLKDTPPRNRPFSRFPRWMWRNTDVDAFVGWLRRRNAKLAGHQRTGFYGLDLYSLHESIHAVVDYLREIDPEAAKVARKRYGCILPYSDEPARYGSVALSKGFAPCEGSVVKVLHDLLAHRLEYTQMDGDDFLNTEGNARLVKDAERYYRAMYYSSEESWNARDTHMFDTLIRLLDAKSRPGVPAKAVVWAHNSHTGDARYTSMGSERSELNIGQLCREHFGREAVLLGFGTHAGTVAAADEWDEPMQVMDVLPSRADSNVLSDSYERVMHDTGIPRFLLDLQDARVRRALEQPRLERFIGVVYRPATERWSHYAEAVLPRQFDALVWFDQTTAVKPIEGEDWSGHLEHGEVAVEKTKD